MHPADALARFIIEHGIEPSHVVLALSGGVDSTALALVAAPLRDAGFLFTAVHVNHRLRGADSEADAEFVRSLASRLGIPFRAEEGPLDAVRIGEVGIEAAAREVRYAALRRVRDELGASWIATAHQKNDQAETVLMRLISGSGPGRLRGIRPRSRDGIIRPLLDSTRKEIDRFLVEAGVTPRLDRSNSDRRYLRNRIRNELLPLLESYNPRIVEALAETARQMREQGAAVDSLLSASTSRAVEELERESRIDLDRLPSNRWILAALIAREARRIDPGGRELSSTDIRRIAEGAGELRRESLSRDAEVLRRGHHLILRRKPGRTGPFEIPLSPGQATSVEAIGATALVDRVPSPVSPPTAGDPGRQLIQLPPETSPRFMIRNRRTGDRFVPLGLDSAKRLSEVLIDRKVPAERRDSVPLLVCDGEIAWIAGVEVSNRFKVRDPSQETWEVLIEYWE